MFALRSIAGGGSEASVTKGKEIVLKEETQVKNIVENK